MMLSPLVSDRPLHSPYITSLLNPEIRLLFAYRAICGSSQTTWHEIGTGAGL